MCQVTLKLSDTWDSVKLSKRDVAADSIMTLVNKSDTDGYVLEITIDIKTIEQVDTKLDTICKTLIYF